MNFKKIFYNFLCWDDLSLDTSNIEKFVYNLKSTTASVNRSNVSGWQSPDITIFDNSNVALHPLIEKIKESVSELSLRFKIVEDLKLLNMWINVNNNGGHNKPHTHPQSFFSGVYYVKYPKDSGDLIFIHPNIYHEMFIPKVKELDEYSSSRWAFTPRKNALIFFPSEIMHYVETNVTNEDRISIAFNIGRNQ
jgi:uncharacterized protein (TIGR02466 family)